MKLSRNTVLITGGATGIGFSLAESMLARGNKVIICGRREDRLLEAQRKHPELIVRVCDVSGQAGRQSLFDWAVSEFPDLNVLVNNAGIQRDIDLSKGLDDLQAGASEIAINLEAPIYLSALFIPHLSGLKEAAIINVSSGLGFMPMPGMPIYCATKAALHTYTLLLRHQLSKTSVKVYEVIPPMVDTELNQEGRNKRGMQFRGIRCDEYVAGVIKGLEQDEFEIYSDTMANLKTTPRAELENRLLSR